MKLRPKPELSMESRAYVLCECFSEYTLKLTHKYSNEKRPVMKLLILIPTVHFKNITENFKYRQKQKKYNKGTSFKI